MPSLQKEIAMVGEARTNLMIVVPRHIISPEMIAPLAATVLWSSLIAVAASCGLLPAWAAQGAERLLTGLGSVTGLLLAFRSNSAVSRWEGGSKAWTSVQASIRSLLRLLTSSLITASGNVSGSTVTDDRVDDALRLLPCFALALMIQLEGRMTAWNPRENQRQAARDSPLDSLETLEALLPATFSRRPGSQDSKSVEAHANAARLRRRKFLHRSSSNFEALQKSRSRNQEFPTEAERELKLSQNIDGSGDLYSRASPHLDDSGHVAPSNLASDLLRELQLRLGMFHRGIKISGCDEMLTLSGPVFAHCTGLLNTLNAQSAELERLRDTPMPALLSSHLHFLINLQLLLLPPALSCRVPSALLPFPCLLLTAATFGLHSLSEKLALPFGRDKAKLPMRRYCAEIIREWREMVGRAEDMAAFEAANADELGSEKESQTDKRAAEHAFRKASPGISSLDDGSTNESDLQSSG